MATDFPEAIDDFTNPTGGKKVSEDVGDRTHSEFHSDVNDAIEALEAKLGIDSSEVTTSHDYKLSEITTTDKAVGKAATQTLTNKTLTSPRIGTAILDTNGKQIILTPATASAVNEITITNAAAGNDPLIVATGDDSNIGIMLKGKGSGTIKIGDAELEFPDSDGADTHVLTTNGAGVLGFSAPASAATCIIALPHPLAIIEVTTTQPPVGKNYNTNTTMGLGLVNLTFAITVTKISFMLSAVGTAGKFKFAVYSADGQTKYLEHETATMSETGEKTETLASPVPLAAGVYYFTIVPVDDADLTVYNWNTLTMATWMGDITNAPTLEGTLTVTASTPPATFTASDVTYATSNVPIWRLDA